MQGFIQIPRSLLQHPTVLAAPIAQKWVLITIIEHACFAPCQQDDHQVLIDLLPGQLMITERQLAKLSGGSKDDVRRGIERFSRVKILHQEVRHRKQIITITHKDTYDLICNTIAPASAPKVHQKCTIKEYCNNEIQIKDKDKYLFYGEESKLFLTFEDQKNLIEEFPDKAMSKIVYCITWCKHPTFYENIRKFLLDDKINEKPKELIIKPESAKPKFTNRRIIGAEPGN